MKVDEIIKLSLKLGEKYYIVPGINDTWSLIRNNRLGQIVMDSEHNTEEELKEFVKKHRIYDLPNALAISSIIANTVILGLSITNLFIHSQFLSAFNIGALLIIVMNLIIRNIVGDHNFEIEEKIRENDIEDIKKYQKKIEEISLGIKSDKKKAKGLMSDFKKNEVKSKTIKTKIGTIKGENTTVTRKKVSSTKTSTKKPKTKVEEKKDI